MDISSAVRFDRSERPGERGIWRSRSPCYGRALRVAGRWFGRLFGPFRGRFGSQICYFWFICGKQFTSSVSKSPSVSLTKQLNWVIFRYEVGYFQFEAGYFCVLSGLFLGMPWISPPTPWPSLSPWLSPPSSLLPGMPGSTRLPSWPSFLCPVVGFPFL